MAEHKPRFIPRAKFCEMYDISPSTVMRWANEGILNIRTVGSKTFVDVVTFEESMINE
jgi:predicted site-specific integrase-resolvase